MHLIHFTSSKKCWHTIWKLDHFVGSGWEEYGNFSYYSNLNQLWENLPVEVFKYDQNSVLDLISEIAQ